MILTDRQKRYLRGLGHTLHPVVMTGSAGLTPAVLAEIDRALAVHELLKIRVRSQDRAARDQTVAEICERTGAQLVQRIGHVALLYRPNPEQPKISLPGV
jgi:RNA-binding protein